MDQLMNVLLIILLLNMIHHNASYLQATVSRIFFIFVIRFKNVLMVILNGIAFVTNHNILIEIPSLTSFADVFTIMVDGIISIIVETNNIKCVGDNNSNVAINRRENFEYTENNFNYDNTHDSMGIGIEKNEPMSYDSKQMESIVISLYVFGYNIMYNGVDKGNELEFRFENENADRGEFFGTIVVFNNGVNYSQFLAAAPSSAPQHVFTVDSTFAPSESNTVNVSKCEFNGSKNGSDIYDCVQIYTVYIT